ncbi:hypothetical protein B0H16DRAFT_323876 [Mycena metata]|uniref:N-acetyltransferase domain-containing protein n=1 Tax=Mycena metata TaxID=1033252 RepID=A0AAD7HP55_9AGAR|nr:hypothetical protein B0H16DRAFT_323876 [Mycena metata]
MSEILHPPISALRLSTRSVLSGWKVSLLASAASSALYSTDFSSRRLRSWPTFSLVSVSLSLGSHLLRNGCLELSLRLALRRSLLWAVRCMWSCGSRSLVGWKSSVKKRSPRIWRHPGALRCTRSVLCRGAPHGETAQRRRPKRQWGGVEEVLGCIAIDYLPETETRTAEIRRMLVSEKHCRHGLASRLILETIRHAETMPGVESIQLSTSEFQSGARRLYEGFGWECTAVNILRLGTIGATVRTCDFRRPVRIGEYGELRARAEQGAELRRILS